MAKANAEKLSELRQSRILKARKKEATERINNFIHKWTSAGVIYDEYPAEFRSDLRRLTE